MASLNIAAPCPAIPGENAAPPAWSDVVKALTTGKEIPKTVFPVDVGSMSTLPPKCTVLPTREYVDKYAVEAAIFVVFVSVGVHVPEITVGSPLRTYHSSVSTFSSIALVYCPPSVATPADNLNVTPPVAAIVVSPPAVLTYF